MTHLILNLALVSVSGAMPADQHEEASICRWAASAFLGQPPSSATKAGIFVRQMDHNSLGLGRSCIQTQMQIRDRIYEHGLGVGTESDLLIVLAKPAKYFTADIGLNNDPYTLGANVGNLKFVVETDGQEVFRSGMVAWMQPKPVQIDLDGASELALRTFHGWDFRKADHANWANAAITYKDGETVFLDQMTIHGNMAAFPNEVPVTFMYNGKPSRELLPLWGLARTQMIPQPGKRKQSVVYEDPDTKLRMTCEVTLFEAFPAVDWVVWFENAGDLETPVLERIRSLDLTLTLPPIGSLILHHSNGSRCEPGDFLPQETPLKPGDPVRLAPVGGRSSNVTFPFFNVDWGHEGLVCAVGWSGQWAATVERTESGEVVLQAGQETTHLKLLPGEKIRTPRILLVHWQGDRYRGHNDMRRLIYDCYTPLLSGEKPLPPISCNTYFTYTGEESTTTNARQQIELLRAYQPLGIEYLVIDAGWFDPPLWNTVGDWRPSPSRFPDGLKPVGRVSAETGIPLGLWFEHERVRRGLGLDKEHPEWLLQLDGVDERLVNLGLPEAREWFIDLVAHYVEEAPLGLFRHDFNLNPLPYWQEAEAPDRIGCTENHYIQGLYYCLDELHRRFPHLLIEGCASGGRRMDLEYLSRCHLYFNSDLFYCSDANQVHRYGGNLYLPPLFQLFVP